MDELNLKDLAEFAKGNRSFNKLSGMAKGMAANLSNLKGKNCEPLRSQNIVEILSNVDFNNQPFSGGMLLDYMDGLIEAGKDLDGSLHQAVDSMEAFKSDFPELLKRTSSSIGEPLYRSYTNSIMSEYMRNFDSVMDMMNGEDEQHLQLDPVAFEEFSGKVQQSYSKVLSYMGTLRSLELDGNRKLNAFEARIYESITVKANKELKALKEMKDSISGMTDISVDFSELASDNANQISNLYDNKVADYQRTLFFMRRGQFFSAIKAGKSLLSAPKKAKDATQASKMVTDAMSSFLGPFSSLMPILEVVLKVGMKHKAAMMGFNDEAAEFNQELIKHHGLISQGIEFIPNPDVKTIADMFNNFNTILSAYGFDSGTFLTREEVMSITSSFEKYGKRLYNIANTKENLEEHIHVILKMHLSAGLSIEESSDYVAKWHHVLGLDLDEIGVMVSEIRDVSRLTGYSQRHLLETLNNTNSDYGITTMTLMTTLKAQELALTKGKLTQKLNSEAMTDLVARIMNMSQGDFAKLVHPLEQQGKLSGILAEEIMLWEEYEKVAGTQQQKLLAQRKVYILKGAASKDPYWQRLALLKEASPETLIRIYAQAMPLHMGEEFIKSLDKGVMSMSMEQSFKAILGISGSRADFEKIKEATRIAIENQDQFSNHAALTNLKKSLKSQIAGYENEKEILTAGMSQQKTVSEMQGAFIQKWMSKIVTSSDAILGHLRRWWLGRLVGGDLKGTESDQARIKAGEAAELIAKLATASESEKKDLLAQIEAKFAEVQSLGGNVKELLSGTASLELSDELKTLIEKYSTSSGSGNVAIDIGNVQYDAKRGEELWNTAQEGAARARRQYGTTTGHCMAGIRHTFGILKDSSLDGLMSAYMAADKLAKHPRFSEVKVTDNSTIINAPRGSIIVYGPNPGKGTKPGFKHGHIAFMDGNGWEISDHKAKSDGTHYANGWRRLFVPSAGGSAAPPSAQTPGVNHGARAPVAPRGGSGGGSGGSRTREVTVSGSVPGAGTSFQSKAESLARR